MRSFGERGKDPLSWNGGTEERKGRSLLKLRSDLLPLRRSGSFRLAIFPGN